MNDRTTTSRRLPLLVFGISGALGMAVDAGDLAYHTGLAPQWLGRKDPTVAALLLLLIGGLVAYRLRHPRT